MKPSLTLSLSRRARGRALLHFSRGQLCTLRRHSFYLLPSTFYLIYLVFAGGTARSKPSFRIELSKIISNMCSILKKAARTAGSK